MVLTKAERETIITYNEEEDTASVYTCNKALIRKLDSFCSKSTMFIIEKQDEWSREYQIPKRCISVRFPTKISDELHAEMASRARELSEYRKRKGYL